MGMFYAHSREDNADTSTWQTMAEHEVGVAKRAEDFAAKFDAGAYGRLLGLWHDLGKYHPAFQEKLYGAGHSFEHAGAGAALAVEKAPRDGVALAFAIAGHHGGLANAKGGDGKPATPLATRLKNNAETLRALRKNVPASLLAECVPPLSADMGDRQDARLEFWIRMIFSCLVDADWLDTESFADGNKGRKRGGYDSIPALQERLDSHVDRLVAGCTDDAKTRPTFLVRQAILHSCREAAHWEPGLFSLTAPTGSGKTLSALSFALNHARQRHRVNVADAFQQESVDGDRADPRVRPVRCTKTLVIYIFQSTRPFLVATCIATRPMIADRYSKLEMMWNRSAGALTESSVPVTVAIVRFM